MYILIKEQVLIYQFKNSKFISYCFHINNKQKIKNILEQLHLEHNNANHICYAYILDESLQKYDDDNEPRHSAGWIIWELLKFKLVTKTLIVVVRYFNGAKLGVHNLAKSYLNAAKLVLENNLKPYVHLKEIKIQFLYSETNYWNNLIQKYNIEINKKEFLTNHIIYELSIENDSNLLTLFSKVIIE